MREQYEEISQEGFQVIAVAPSNASFISDFLESFGPYPFPIVGDPKRKAYRGMGHHTMPKFKLLSKSLLGFLSGKVKNFIPKDKQQAKVVKKAMTSQDVYIQGGTWIFDEQGNVLWKHIDTSPEKHANINEVIKQVKQAD
ncbi:hypothetical protein CEY16_11245 [Halalkalibacillus sediminis]|uniref:Alkyl hydroperoxide reductase subunit C/ Thiol specific antioxidant domain-containing protein n=1 Tax=Halalkalibacillus sediminis TaxID=2018042 RepID=A0A2I0QSJ0_9BACI|nr:hypothetical protein CEY16_11245 [Halalkalibacillus sediminis]